MNRSDVGFPKLNLSIKQNPACLKHKTIRLFFSHASNKRTLSKSVYFNNLRTEFELVVSII